MILGEQKRGCLQHGMPLGIYWQKDKLVVLSDPTYRR